MPTRVCCLFLFILLLLCAGVPSLAEDDLAEKAMNPDMDIQPLVDQLDTLQRNLLKNEQAYDPEHLVLTAEATQTSKYERVYASFVRGLSYVFTMGSTETLAGNPEGITLRVYDFNAKKTILRHIFLPDRDTPQAWVFTIPAKADVSNLVLLLNAGISGENQGNSIQFDDLALYMWMPGLRETQIINSMQAVTPTVDDLLTHGLDIRPLLDAYAQRHPTDLLSSAGGYDPAQFTVQAGENARYQYQLLYEGLTPGASYLFSVGKTALLAGEADTATLRVYNFSNARTLLDIPLRADSAVPQMQVFTVPDQRGGGDGTYSLLLYAGKAGDTAGNTVAFSDVWLYPWDGVEADADIIAALEPLDEAEIEAEAAQTAAPEGPAPVATYDLLDIGDGGDNAYANVCLYDAFTPGETYLLEIGDIELLQGEATDITIRLFSTAGGDTVSRRTAPVDDGMFEWQFTIARDSDGGTLGLYAYAGIVGKTQGIQVRLHDVTLTQQRIAP